MTIDDILNDIRRVSRILEPALAVIAVAQAATGIGGVTADRALDAIRAALASFHGIADGAVTREQALASLESLRRGLAINDDLADTQLNEKFPG